MLDVMSASSRPVMFSVVRADGLDQLLLEEISILGYFGDYSKYKLTLIGIYFYSIGTMYHHPDQALVRLPRVPNHPLRGELTRGSIKKTIEHRRVENIPVQTGDLPIKYVPILDVGITSVVIKGGFMAYHYAKFLLDIGQEESDKYTLTASMLGLLFNIIDYTRILSKNNELEFNCNSAGFRVGYQIISTDRDILAIVGDPSTQMFLAKLGDGMNNFLNDRTQQLIMFGPIALMLGQSVPPEGYTAWLSRRIRAFMGTFRLTLDDLIWTDPTYPALVSMNRLGNFLSACYTLRKEIFEICWALSGDHNRYYTNLFKEIVGLLKATGMTHIVLIDEYLYNRYKELLSIRMLADNNKGMNAAWKYLANFEEYEMYYCKILQPNESTACLNRNNFPLHIAAAVAAAKYETPSIPYYRGSNVSNKAVTLVNKIVQTYMESRSSLAGISMINATAMFGSSYEVAEYRRMALRRLRETEEERGRCVPAVAPAIPARL
jgi:hypothetical protein